MGKEKEKKGMRYKEEDYCYRACGGSKEKVKKAPPVLRGLCVTVRCLIRVIRGPLLFSSFLFLYHLAGYLSLFPSCLCVLV